MSSTLTLIDHFAALAMQAILSTDYEFETEAADVAEAAYQQADALIKVRNKHLRERYASLPNIN